MASSVTITQAEIIEALTQAARGAAPEEARTVPELAASAGLPESRIRAGLHALRAQGRLMVHKVWRENITGAPQRVPAYTILPAKNRKRAA